jgi:hypothetical protein
VSDFKVAHTKTERKVLEDINNPFIVSLRFAYQTDTKASERSCRALSSLIISVVFPVVHGVGLFHWR